MTLAKNIFSAILFTGIFALHPSLNKGETPITYLQYFVYGNSLEVATNNSIDKSLIEIKWVCASSTTDCEDLVIFKGGKQINEIPFEQGNQKLVVYYDANFVADIPQNKSTKKQAHEYKIELSSRNNALFFNGEILGPSPYHGPSVTIASL